MALETFVGTWSGMGTFGNSGMTWGRLESLRVAWGHLGTWEVALGTFGNSGMTWGHLRGGTDDLESLRVAWGQMGTLGKWPW